MGSCAHAGGAEFVDGHAGHFDAGLFADIFCAGGFEHFGGGGSGIFHEGGFVVAVGHGDAEGGNAPGVLQVGVDFDDVVPAG